MEKNKELWNDIYTKGFSYMQYPNEALVISYHRIKRALPKEVTCLDYGFGSGNNSEFIISKVNDFYGLEVSAKAKEISSKRLKEYENFDENRLVLSENKFIPEFENKFDLIVAWHVISYNTEDSLKEVINMLKKYLKKDGVLITTLATKKDITFKCSKEISNNTYKINEKIPNQEGCVVIIPKDEKEFKNYFQDFETMDIGYEERISLEHEDYHSHYYGIFRKQ